ncbi:MAG: hypothetical protein SGI87_07425 [Flavobacteriales bacterium]|nr:hypothetical protein [Flavobacteriales bacterium]
MRDRREKPTATRPRGARTWSKEPDPAVYSEILSESAVRGGTAKAGESTWFKVHGSKHMVQSTWFKAHS